MPLPSDEEKAVSQKRGGLSLFGTGGWGLYFPTTVTSASSGIQVSSRSSEGFSTLTLFKDSQPEKAPLPMLVTLSGIVTLVKEEHFKKAQPPILLTLFGIVMLFKEEQPLKALSSIILTLFGIVTFFNPPGTATSVFPSLVNKSPEVDLKEGLPESKEKDVRLEQLGKALLPILLTLFGIVKLVKDSQPQKASLRMLVTPYGIVTFVNPPGTATSVFPSFVNKSPEIDVKEGLPESTEKDMRLEQLAKAFSPILVTLSGIVMLFKDLQP